LDLRRVALVRFDMQPSQPVRAFGHVGKQSADADPAMAISVSSGSNTNAVSVFGRFHARRFGRFAVTMVD
jgi:hypothetical protein